MKLFFIILIFFSGTQLFSMNSTENRQALVEVLDVDRIDLISLQSTLFQLWEEGSFRGNSESLAAYEAFLDMASGNYPLVSEKTAKRLVLHGLAIKDQLDGEFLFDNNKLVLWNTYGSLSDGMRPIIKNLKE